MRCLLTILIFLSLSSPAVAQWIPPRGFYYPPPPYRPAYPYRAYAPYPGTGWARRPYFFGARYFGNPYYSYPGSYYASRPYPYYYGRYPYY